MESPVSSCCISGWWFAYCLRANLNGRYSKADGRYRTFQYHDGIVWLDGRTSSNERYVPAIKLASMEISRGQAEGSGVLLQ